MTNNNAPQMIVTARFDRVAQTWGIYLNGRLVEGGFLSRAAAQSSLDWWRANAANFVAHVQDGRLWKR